METIESVIEKMDALVAAADAENRSFTDEECDKYEALERDLSKLRRDQEIRSRHQAYKTPIRSAIHVSGSDESDDKEYRAAFDRYLRTGDKGILAEFRAQSVGGTGAEGGFTAPDGFRNKLVDRVVSYGGIASVAETITTATGAELSWVTLDDTGNSGEIAAEGVSGTAGADLTFGQKKLGAYKYVAPGADNSGDDPLRVSVELLQDSAFDIEALIVRKLGERIARKQAAHWAYGDGSGEPLGLAYGTPATSFSTATAHDDLIDIMHSLDPYYRQNAVWVMNDSTLAEIRKIKDKDDRPLWLPQAQSGLVDNPGGVLLGHRVVIDQGMPNLSGGATPTGNAIVFGDIAESYVIRRVRDVQLVVDPYTRAAQGEVCFTVWARADGTVQNDWSYVVAVG